MKRITNINDYYGVILDWENFKTAITKVDDDFLKFYGPTKTKAAGVRVRKRMRVMLGELKGMRKKLLMQSQDYESEY